MEHFSLQEIEGGNADRLLRELISEVLNIIEDRLLSEVKEKPTLNVEGTEDLLQASVCEIATSLCLCHLSSADGTIIL